MRERERARKSEWEESERGRAKPLRCDAEVPGVVLVSFLCIVLPQNEIFINKMHVAHISYSYMPIIWYIYICIHMYA